MKLESSVSIETLKSLYGEDIPNIPNIQKAYEIIYKQRNSEKGKNFILHLTSAFSAYAVNPLNIQSNYYAFTNLNREFDKYFNDLIIGGAEKKCAILGINLDKLKQDEVTLQNEIGFVSMKSDKFLSTSAVVALITYGVLALRYDEDPEICVVLEMEKKKLYKNYLKNKESLHKSFNKRTMHLEKQTEIDTVKNPTIADNIDSDTFSKLSKMKEQLEKN